MYLLCPAGKVGFLNSIPNVAANIAFHVLILLGQYFCGFCLHFDIETVYLSSPLAAAPIIDTNLP
jgi:hypothetical protein